MKSKPVSVGEEALASQLDGLRDDARGASFLLPHQQLGAFAMPTNPTNGQTITWTINGSAIVVTFVDVLGTLPASVLIGVNIAATDVNLLAFQRNPSANNSTQVSAGANAQLIQYVGWALPVGGTTITPFSLNNTQNTQLSSFSASTTVTGASWTAQTLKLYIEAGVYYIGTTRVIYAGGSTPLFTAPATNPRIDIVTADSSGTIAITQGSENVSPTAPAYPANKVVICEVYNVVSETALHDYDNQHASQGYIYNDVRPFLQPAYISATSQVANGLFLLDPGGEAQGAIPFQGAAALQFLAHGTSGQFLKSQGASADPTWSSINVSEADGTFASGTLTGTTSPQSSDIVITHGLGRTPALILLTCNIAPSNNPSSGVVNAQMNMTYNGSGTAVAGFTVKFFPNLGTYSSSSFSFGGATSTYSVTGVGATQASTVTVSITTITTTQFTIHITYQVTTGSGSDSGNVVGGSWGVIG